MDELSVSAANAATRAAGTGVNHAPDPSAASADPLSRFRLRMYSEGPRSIATRSSVWLRYCVYMLTILGGCLLTHIALNAAGTTAYGGALMWLSCFIITSTAAAATVLYPTRRNDTISQFRHYIFGYCVFPGTAIAILIWALSSVVTSPTANDDTMASLLRFAIPAVFVCTVVIPPIIFVKLIAGYHTMYTSLATDQEVMTSLTRQDQLQR